MFHSKILIIALVSVGTLAGVGSASAQSCPTPSDVAGTWRWLESRSGQDADKITPLSEGFELRLKFEEDGSALIRVDTEESDGSYQLECDRSSHTALFVLDAPDLKLRAPLGSALRMPYRLSTSPLGELFLMAECLGCWSHTFIFDTEQTPVEGLTVGIWKARWTRD